MSKPEYPWRIFWALLAAALCGSFAVLPYVIEVFSKAGVLEAPANRTPLYVVMQVLHLILIYGIAIALGLLLAPKVDLRYPILSRWFNGTSSFAPTGTLRVALVAGILCGAVSVLVLYAVILPNAPNFPKEASVPLWKRFLVCIYGGINEELVMRLCLLALFLWVLQRIFRRSARSSPAIFWSANTLVALLYGAAYLPAIAKVVPLTPFLVLSVVSLVGAVGLVYGRLTWRRGLEAAMLAHFVSDLVLHLLGPFFGLK